MKQLSKSLTNQSTRKSDNNLNKKELSGNKWRRHTVMILQTIHWWKKGTSQELDTTSRIDVQIIQYLLSVFLFTSRVKNEVLSFSSTNTLAHTHLQLTDIPLDQVPRDVKKIQRHVKLTGRKYTHTHTSTPVYLEYFVLDISVPRDRSLAESKNKAYKIHESQFQVWSKENNNFSP